MPSDIYNRNGFVVGTVTPIDELPTQNSQNVVQSGGVYETTKNDKSVVSTLTNLIDKTQVIPGTINTTTGAIDASTVYHVTDFIEVNTDNIYIAPNCNLMGAYNENKQFISTVAVQPTTTNVDGAVVFPEGTKYIRLRIIQDGVDGAIFADVRYYNEDPAQNTVFTGFSEDFELAFPDGFLEYAYGDEAHYTKSNNIFDYNRDYYQVTSGSGGGLISNNGSFQYRHDIITNDEEIEGSFRISMDKYYPIEYGQMLASNKVFDVVVFYDANKQFIKWDYGYTRTHRGIIAPENSAYARISFAGSSTNPILIQSLSEIKDICVWTMPHIGSNDYTPAVKFPPLALQLDGRAISANYLDKVIPNMADSQFLSAMRCLAIREANARDHAWRFGAFNMWIMESTKGWDMTKKMLMDYGVDFCGFEECVINQSTNNYKGIAEFLHGWQFQSGFYTNWTDGAETQIDKSFVSRFEVIESTKLSFPSATSNATYLNCKVQLPRYMDVYNPTRVLSVYVVHFPITDTAGKIAVARDLLTQISTDNSDFVVILGDTNDFGTTPETKYYWTTIEAGGFKPVLPYNIKTITMDTPDKVVEGDPNYFWKEMAIDQFFISSNIEAVNYGIKNTKEDYAIPDSYISPSTDNVPALSDHDFVYCDLRFKYDEPRTIVPVPD